MSTRRILADKQLRSKSQLISERADARNLAVWRADFSFHVQMRITTRMDDGSRKRKYEDYKDEAHGHISQMSFYFKNTKGWKREICYSSSILVPPYEVKFGAGLFPISISAHPASMHEKRAKQKGRIF